MAARVSLAMLAEKDSPTLERCLASVADLVDENVVGTDRGADAAWRKEANGYGARLVEFERRNDFELRRYRSMTWGRIERISQILLFRNLSEIGWRYRLHERLASALFARVPKRNNNHELFDGVTGAVHS